MGITVTHISSVHPVFDIRIFYKECKSLADNNYDVHLIITHTHEETVEGVHIIPLPSYKNRLARILIKPFLALHKALKTKADIYHFHDPELIPVGVLLKIFGKTVIYDVHEDVPSQILHKVWIPKKLRVITSKGMHLIESFSSRWFDGIICATPYISGIFLSRNNNTVNINNYPLPAEVRHFEKKAKSSNKKIICYAGGITKQRGIYEILKAIEGTDITLYLAGKPSPSNLLDHLKQEKGWENVVFFGQVGRPKLLDILSESKVGMLLFHPIENHINCIPNKLFEYMSARLPVVASNIPFWTKLMDKSESVIFVNPFNAEEVRGVVQALLNSPEKAQSLGKNGYAAVKTQFNWCNEEKKLLDFYQSLAG